MARIHQKIIMAFAGIFLMSVLAACSVFSKTPGIVSTQAGMKTEIPSIHVSPVPTATPTPETPKRVLTICTGKEPSSLFIYGDRSGSAQTIWQAIYGEMIDQPKILKEVPSMASGTVKLVPMEVKSGDLIMTANGDWAALKEGIRYRPSGCLDASCAQTYTGNDPVKIDQVVVDFHLQPGIKWSDGSSLTADDSVYSYEVAKSLYPAAKPEIVSMTQSYRAVDETTLEWIGVPGFQAGPYEQFFFSPLPRHAWNLISPQDLAQSPLASQTPLGWGPFVIDEWAAGDHISLHKNPQYAEAAQGLPHFDTLVIRFTSSGKDALDALAAGECDLADDSTGLEAQAARLQELEGAAKVKVYPENNTAWEQILFNSSPADPKQPNFFGKKEVRQAIAYCTDRQSITAGQLTGDSQPADSYVPPDRPFYQAEITKYPYDPEKGNQLLTAAGWMDADNDPATPRAAQGVPGVTDGTSFTVNYLTTEDEQSQKTAVLMKELLAKCGVQLNVQPMSWEKMLASGPEGPVFGRSFDMAQFAWALPPQNNACWLFMSTEIPGVYPEAPKGWGGANAGGYQNPKFDGSCQTVLTSLPDAPGYLEAQKQAQAIFGEDLPALPLFFRAKMLASRPDFCGINLSNSSSTSGLNFATMDYAEGCN